MSYMTSRGELLGRRNIFSNDRQSRSKRENNLEVIKKYCPHCNHHKIFIGNINPDGQNIKKCCKCKKVIIWD